MAEDLITELSRFRALFVIARNSSFAFRGQQIDAAEIARRLAVRYLVEGSLRRVGNRVRITVQLIDASTGAHLWADRYDRDLEDIFAVQDEVVRTVVATVAGRLEAAGAELAKRKPPESLLAYDYVLRGVEQLNLVGDQHNAEARRLFQKAVELDQQYAAGHAYLALAIYMEWQTNRDPGELQRALTSARRALALDSNDSRCHRILSVIYINLREFDRAKFHSDRSSLLTRTTRSVHSTEPACYGGSGGRTRELNAYVRRCNSILITQTGTGTHWRKCSTAQGIMPRR